MNCRAYFVLKLQGFKVVELDACGSLSGHVIYSFELVIAVEKGCGRKIERHTIPNFLQ